MNDEYYKCNSNLRGKRKQQREETSLFGVNPIFMELYCNSKRYLTRWFLLLPSNKHPIKMPRPNPILITSQEHLKEAGSNEDPSNLPPADALPLLPPPAKHPSMSDSSTLPAQMSTFRSKKERLNIKKNVCHFKKLVCKPHHKSIGCWELQSHV